MARQLIPILEPSCTNEECLQRRNDSPNTDALTLLGILNKRNATNKQQRHKRSKKIRKMTEKCKVLFDFEAQTEQELTVKAGDTIELTTDYGDGWAECIHQGRSGLVPVTFFKRLQPSRIIPASMLPPQKPFTKVTVQVYEAQNLEIKDLVSSDPYVVVQVGDSEKQKTKTVYKNLNPKWENAFFSFPAPPKDKEFVKFALYDKDFLSKDDPMGIAIVTLGALRFGGNPMWLDLTDCAKGKLHVNIILHV